MATTPNDPIKMYEDAIKPQKTHPSIEAVAKKEKPLEFNFNMKCPLADGGRKGVREEIGEQGYQKYVAQQAKGFVVSKEDVQFGKHKSLEPEFSKAHDGRNI